MVGEKLGGGNGNGNIWDSLSQGTRDQIALDALKADLKQKADEEKRKETADKIAAEAGINEAGQAETAEAGQAGAVEAGQAETAGSVNWEDVMKGVDFLDGTKVLTEEERAQAERREAFQTSMDRLKEKNVEFEDAYADAMAVRNSLWDRMSGGEKLTSEEELALYEAEATLRQARLQMEDVQKNGLSSEYIDGKKEERGQQMFAAAEVLDSVYEQNQAAPNGMESNATEAAGVVAGAEAAGAVAEAAGVVAGAEAAGVVAGAEAEKIVDTGVKLSPEQERAREIFRENLEKNPNNIPRVEANKQAKSQLKTWQRVVVGATAVFMMLKAGMGIYDHLKTPNTEPISVTEDDMAEQDVDESEKDVMRIDANYYVEDENGEKEQITENIAQRDSIEFGNHQIFDTEVDKDGAFDDASKKEGEHSFGTHLAPSQLSGDKLGGCREYVGNLAERLSQQDVSLAEMLGELGMLEAVGVGENSPNGINDAIDIISRMPAEERQALLDSVLDGYAEMIEGTTVSSTTFGANHAYITKYAVKITENGEERMKTFVDSDASKPYDFEVMQYLDDEGNNILDEGEIKLNILKAHGLVSPDAELDSEEAQAAMKRYTVVGERAACGRQMVIVENGDNDSAGAEGDGSNGSEGTEGNESDGSEGTEGNESDGSEGTEGNESDGSEGTEGNESDGSEGTEGNESDGSEGTEGNESDGSEGTEGNESDGSEGTEGNESDGSEGTEGNESEGKTFTIDDPHNPPLGETDIEDNSGIVHQTETNDGTKVADGAEVTTQTQGERESGAAAGSDAIIGSQGVVNGGGEALTDAMTGNQVVNENRNGDNTATQQQITDAQNGVASNYSAENQSQTNENYGGGEIQQAENRQEINETPPAETGDQASAGANEDRSDADLGAIFNNN